MSYSPSAAAQEEQNWLDLERWHKTKDRAEIKRLEQKRVGDANQSNVERYIREATIAQLWTEIKRRRSVPRQRAARSANGRWCSPTR